MPQGMARFTMRVVYFPEKPTLPVKWWHVSDGKWYENLLQQLFMKYDYWTNGFSYQETLVQAIARGEIDEPGLYGISRVPRTHHYDIYKLDRVG